MNEYLKPIPPLDEDILPFWEAAGRHEFVLQRCRNCGSFYFPASYCLKCDQGFSTPWAENMEWVKASGKGKVLTFCVYHQLYTPAFKNDIPYNTAVVELAEGPLIFSQVVGCKNEEITVGMPVEVVFTDVTPDVTLPMFRPLERARQ